VDQFDSLPSRQDKLEFLRVSAARMGGTFTWGSASVAQPQSRKQYDKSSQKKSAKHAPPKAKPENLTSEAIAFKSAQKLMKKAVLNYQHTPEMLKDDPSLVSALTSYNEAHKKYFSTKLKENEVYQAPEPKALPAKEAPRKPAAQAAAQPTHSLEKEVSKANPASAATNGSVGQKPVKDPSGSQTGGKRLSRKKGHNNS
jgi:hypothetical protein